MSVLPPGGTLPHRTSLESVDSVSNRSVAVYIAGRVVSERLLSGVKIVGSCRLLQQYVARLESGREGAGLRIRTTELWVVLCNVFALACVQ